MTWIGLAGAGLSTGDRHWLPLLLLVCSSCSDEAGGLSYVPQSYPFLLEMIEQLGPDVLAIRRPTDAHCVLS